ncbi:MAG: hypothetical protein N3B21_05125 [Clostridia bacterium]|nr:hypothetical protein [Clostridia bacterium]
MGQIMAIILITILIIFTFVPLAVLSENRSEVQLVKQNLNLAARAVCNAIESSEVNYENISKGYERNAIAEEITIDKDRLLGEFNDVLAKNYYDEAKTNGVKSRIYLKVLVYNDKFFVVDKTEEWSLPYFFTYYSNSLSDFVYLSTLSDQAYYYSGGNKVYQPMTNFGITNEQKNDIIINKINEVVAKYTNDITEIDPLKIEIKNPDKQDIEYKVKHRNFNVLDGITFFVVFAEDTNLFVNSKSFKFKNYNVTGYTLNLKEGL